MGMQEIYKGIAISKGLAKFDDLYFVTRPKKRFKSQRPKEKLQPQRRANSLSRFKKQNSCIVKSLICRKTFTPYGGKNIYFII